MLERKSQNSKPNGGYPDMIFIPGNAPSLKNSKVKTSRGIFSSPTVNKYIRSIGIQKYSASRKEVKGYADPTRANLFEKHRAHFAHMMQGKGKPVFIGFHQVRNSKRKFDFGNSVEIIQDLLTAHDFIEDDNVEFVFPIPMTIDGKLPEEGRIREEQWYSVDKLNPGVYLKVF